MRIPTSIVTGDSAAWDDSPTTDNLGNSIESSTWTLKYTFRQASLAAIVVTAAAQGSGWRTTLGKTALSTLGAGVVYWQAYAEKDAERITLGSGTLELLPAPADGAVGAFDGRTQSEKDLEALQAAMRAIIAGGAVAEYMIAGRSLRKMPMADMIQYESILKGRVYRERRARQIANGMGDPSNILVRFRK